MAEGNFGVTHLSGLSVGWDPARADNTPRSRGAGAVLSIGTLGDGIKKVFVSTVSVTPGGVTGSLTTTVAVTVTGVDQNDAVFATPHSQWSGVDCNTVSYTAHAAADDTVNVVFSNGSLLDVTLVATNWQIVAIS